MNDVMSLGIHRIWKEKFIDWMSPFRDSSLIDVASGTGDVAKLFSLRNKNLSKITCIEPNEEMYKKGKSNLVNYKNIELLVIDDCSTDNTYEIINEIKDSRVKIFRNKE